MHRLGTKGWVMIGATGALVIFMVVPRVVTQDMVVGWILVAIIAPIGCWPAYILGGLLSVWVWRVTQCWTTFPRLGLRALALAITFAPTPSAGHGIIAIPAIVAVASFFFESNLVEVLTTALKALAFMWVVFLLLLVALEKLKARARPLDLGSS